MTQAYPLKWPAGWPRSLSRKRAKFHNSGRTWGGGKTDLSIADGTKRIVDELSTMGIRGGGFVISTDLVLRNDGLPRSDQRAPADPGAAVYWTRKGQQQVMAIDIYDRVQDNLAAIATSLNALRAIERHGGAQILDRAFAGFTALASPDAFDPWAVLGLRPGASQDDIEDAFRRQARKHHPDVGGNTDDFQRLERARREALA